MKKDDEELNQLAVRIPKELQYRLKLHCVKQDLSIMDFVVEAIREKLREGGTGKKKRTA